MRTWQWERSHAATFFYPANVPDVDPATLQHGVTSERRYRYAQREPLASRGQLDAPLQACLGARSSCRAFRPETVAAHEVDLLVEACLVGSRREGEPAGRSRPTPSAGGGFPVEAYVVPRQVTGWGNRLRHLHLPRAGGEDAVWEVLGFDPLLRDSTFGQVPDEVAGMVVLTAVMDRMYGKYGERSYRFALLEAGHVAQNVLLGLEASRDLRGFLVGGFSDRHVRSELRLDGTTEWPLYVIPFGRPADRDGTPAAGGVGR